MIKPQPVVVKVLCSLCDLDWTLHGDKPTTEDCIRLLKQELSRRPHPYVYRQPYPYQVTYGAGHDFNIATNGISTNAAVEYRTPEVS